MKFRLAFMVLLIGCLTLAACDDDIGERDSSTDVGLADVADTAQPDVEVGEQVSITGSVTGDVDFGSGAISSFGNRDIFLATFDRDGNNQWTRFVGGAQTDQLGRLALAPDGYIYATGYFSLTVDFGAGDVTSNGSRDIFLWALEP